MKQFPKVSNEFNTNYFQYSQQPIDKTISFRLPSALADAFNSAVKKMGAKSSDELRNFMFNLKWRTLLRLKLMGIKSLKRL